MSGKLYLISKRVCGLRRGGLRESKYGLHYIKEEMKIEERKNIKH